MINLNVGEKLEINNIVVEVVSPEEACGEKFLVLSPKDWTNVCVILSENHLKNVVSEIATNPTARYDGATIKATNNLNQAYKMLVSDFETIIRWASGTNATTKPNVFGFTISLEPNKTYN